jgi:hypothetical protein
VNPEEYAAQQAVISAAIANYALQFGSYFAQPLLSLAEWLGILQLMFPEVQRRREESAALARFFYDSQRELYHPELPRNDRFLEDYKFEWFVENMEPAREKMSQEDSPADAVGTLALRAVREVENAGRRQIIHAVENDPAPGVIKGWARVATGAETCAWCLMLVSRGPVYMFASSAGLNVDDTTAQRMVAAGTDVSDVMEQWHDGCDCKVVPVFVHEAENWFGKAASKRALELWNDATRVAISEEDEGKVHPSGKDKGKPFTRNELAINALRRRLENGDISPSEWSALSAA